MYTCNSYKGHNLIPKYNMTIFFHWFQRYIKQTLENDEVTNNMYIVCLQLLGNHRPHSANFT